MPVLNAKFFRFCECVIGEREREKKDIAVKQWRFKHAVPECKLSTIRFISTLSDTRKNRPGVCNSADSIDNPAAAMPLSVASAAEVIQVGEQICVWQDHHSGGPVPSVSLCPVPRKSICS